MNYVWIGVWARTDLEEEECSKNSEPVQDSTRCDRQWRCVRLSTTESSKAGGSPVDFPADFPAGLALPRELPFSRLTAVSPLEILCY